MLACFAPPASPARAVRVVAASGYAAWLEAAPAPLRDWLGSTGFKPKAGATALLPDGGALLLVASPGEPWDAAALQAALPPGDWRLDDPEGLLAPERAALGWALAAYRFTRYRRDETAQPRLVLPEGPGVPRALELAAATWQARDLVNTPANDLGPAELAAAVAEVAASFGAECQVTVGEALIAAGYPAVHAVGPRQRPRAAADRPALGRPGGTQGDARGQGRVLRHRRARHQAVQQHAADEEGHGRRRAHAGGGALRHGAGPAGAPAAPDPGGREQHRRLGFPSRATC